MFFHCVMAVQVLQPAIELAEDGFPLSPVTAHYWGLGLSQIQRQGGPGVKSFCTKDGKAPKAGQIHRNADLAATFRSVAENGALEGGPSTHFPLASSIIVMLLGRHRTAQSEFGRSCRSSQMHEWPCRLFIVTPTEMLQMLAFPD